MLGLDSLRAVVKLRAHTHNEQLASALLHPVRSAPTTHPIGCWSVGVPLQPAVFGGVEAGGHYCDPMG